MLRYKTASPMMSTAVIGLMKEKHMNRFWQREELNYFVRLRKMINFQEHFFHNRKYRSDLHLLRILAGK